MTEVTVKRWTGVVEAHELGGFVALGDYMELAKEVERYAAINRTLAAALEASEAEVGRLNQLITKLHTAKGRYHTQLAACDLFDAVGLKNERPVK